MTMPQGKTGLESGAWGYEWLDQIIPATYNSTTNQWVGKNRAKNPLQDRDRNTIEAHYKAALPVSTPWASAHSALFNTLMGGWVSLNQFLGGLVQAITGSPGGMGDIANTIGGIINSIATIIGRLFDSVGNFVATITGAVIDSANTTLEDYLSGIYAANRGQGAYTNANDVVHRAQVVTDLTYDTSFATWTHSEFWNTPRSVPAWWGTTTDDVSFPISNITDTEAPPLGRLTLIPVTVSQDRTYDVIHFGMSPANGVFSMTSLYVGLFDVDEETGTLLKVVGSELGLSGNCKAFLNADYNQQSIPIAKTVATTTAASATGGTATLTLSANPNVSAGDEIVVAGVTPTAYNGRYVVTAASAAAPWTVSYASTATGSQTVAGFVAVPQPKSVIKGELFCIGVLQVGGTSVPMHKWNSSANFSTGKFPRYIGSYYNGGTIGALPGDPIDKSLVVSGPKFWGSLGLDSQLIAPGSRYYSDTFDRPNATSLGPSWNMKYGPALRVVNSAAQADPNTTGIASYNGRLLTTSHEVGCKITMPTSYAFSTSISKTVLLGLRGDGTGNFVYARINTSCTYSVLSGGVYYPSFYGINVKIYTASSYDLPGTQFAGGVLKTPTAFTANANGTGNWSFSVVPANGGQFYQVKFAGNPVLSWTSTDNAFPFTENNTEVLFGLYSQASGAPSTLTNWYGKDF